MDHKAVRKQVRNVLQEVGKEMVTSEVGDLVEQKLLKSMNVRLDNIDKYCQQNLEKQDKRSRAIQSFLLQEVKFNLQEELFNISCTIDAVVSVLAESGISIPDFTAKVDTKKVAISEAKKKAAEEKMKADNERHAAEEAAKKEQIVSPDPETQSVSVPEAAAT